LPTKGIWLGRGTELSAAERFRWFHYLLNIYATWSAAEYPAGKQIVEFCLSLIEQSRTVLERLEQSMPTLKFCRSDPRFANVIKRPDGRLGFVDWEDAGLRDPALELSDLMLHTEQEDLLTQTDYHSFLATYCQEMESDPERLSSRIEEYGLVIPLFYMLILMRYGVGVSKAGRLAEWQINEMPANLRLQRYLARAMAGSMFDFDPSAYADVLFFPTS
jgi:thiamine kinase-like enzyme